MIFRLFIPYNFNNSIVNNCKIIHSLLPLLEYVNYVSKVDTN